MKRYSMVVVLGILIAGLTAAQSLKGTTMYVAIKSVQLKTSTDVLGGNRGTLEYGDQVTVLQEKGKWVEVSCTQPALSGWLASSSLTSKRIVSSRGSVSISTKELALAGKGFSPEVERAYKQDSSLDYTAVDDMESQQISDQEVQDFRSEGHLTPEE